MDPKTLQIELFRQLKMSNGHQQDFVEHIAALLEVSTDSCYRRVRGEKLMDLSELMTVCRHYKLSLDNLLGLQSGRISFTSNHAKPAEYDFNNYMKGLLQNMQFLNSVQERKMYYECKDIPIFYHFHSRGLAAFKYFFWHKFLFRQKEMHNAYFDMDGYSDAMYEVGCKAASLYFTMPSVEFWNIETINSTLRQLMFFYDTGSFKEKDDALMVLQCIEDLIHDLQHTCRSGQKSFLRGCNQLDGGGTIEVFLNEVLQGSNSILVKLGASRVVYLNHSVFNYATTTDLAFGTHMEAFFKTLAESSTQISEVSELERNIFFNGQYDAIAICKKKIMG